MMKGGTTGTVRSEDVAKPSGRNTADKYSSETSPQCLERSKKLNMQAFDANAEINVDDSRTLQASDACDSDYSPASIYSKFTQAISQSVLSSICEDGQWLRIGSSCCIGAAKFDVAERNDDDTGLLSSSSELLLLSVSIWWCSSGCVRVVGDLNPTKDIHILSKEYGVQDRFLSQTEPLVALSPSGVRADLLGDGSTGHHDVKKSIIARLQHQNIGITIDEKWANVRVGGEIEADITLTTVWPARLCLLRNRSTTEHPITGPLDVTDPVELWANPLEDAERWFNDRSTRAKMIEAKRKANERAAEATIEKGELDEREAWGYDEAITSGRLPLQDMSSVYPTPPDGAPHHPQSVGSLPEQPAQVPAGLPSSADVRPAQGIHSSAASPSFDETPAFHDDGGVDLFGEFDSEIFAANGLTEDDFKFFDEPSPEVVDEIQQSQLPEKPFSEANDVGQTAYQLDLGPYGSFPATADNVQSNIDDLLQNIRGEWVHGDGESRILIHSKSHSTDSMQAQTRNHDSKQLHRLCIYLRWILPTATPKISMHRYYSPTMILRTTKSPGTDVLSSRTTMKRLYIKMSR